ncbi:hypothetical protein V1477_001845 [Vespula maculifrons]|uniref:Uncharacterized protein n=1 Tax=Vespula maculifrons TaxID=7453 RepID=A0ABD2CYP3_VESMC
MTTTTTTTTTTTAKKYAKIDQIERLINVTDAVLAEKKKRKNIRDNTGNKAPFAFEQYFPCNIETETFSNVVFSTSTRAPAPVPTLATSSVTVTATATATATAPGSFCFAIGGVPSYIYIVSSYCTLSTLPHCPNSQRHSLARLAVLPTATMTHLHVQTRSTQPVLFSAQSATDFKLVMYSIKIDRWMDGWMDRQIDGWIDG